MPTNEPNPHAADLFAAIKTPEDLNAVLRQTMHRTMYMAADAAEYVAALPISTTTSAPDAMKAFAETLRETASETWGTAE